MRTFMISVLAFLAAGSAYAATLSDTNAAEYELDRVTPEIAFKHRLGRKLIKQSERVLKCTYSFAVLGGASGTALHLKNEDGKDCIVPKSAIIEQVLIDVLTAGTTSASGTAAITAQSAGDLKAALAAASYSGIVAGVPVGTASTSIKMTADRTVTQSIATGPLTAGKWNVLIRYVMSE